MDRNLVDANTECLSEVSNNNDHIDTNLQKQCDGQINFQQLSHNQAHLLNLKDSVTDQVISTQQRSQDYFQHCQEHTESQNDLDANYNLTIENDNSTNSCDNNNSSKDSSYQDLNTAKNYPSDNHKKRFKWSKEMSQVALRLVKHGYRPKVVSIAVGCSLRTAQKFVETVSPEIDGGSFKNFEIKRRGRKKSKSVKERLDAIKEALSKDVNKTQIEIAAQLNVSNTTVCRDIKRIGAILKI